MTRFIQPPGKDKSTNQQQDNILGGNKKKECMVLPLALIADIPVEASITKFFFELLRKYSNNVVLPVPAFPVIKIV